MIIFWMGKRAGTTGIVCLIQFVTSYTQSHGMFFTLFCREEKYMNTFRILVVFFSSIFFSVLIITPLGFTSCVISAVHNSAFCII